MKKNIIFLSLFLGFCASHVRPMEIPVDQIDEESGQREVSIAQVFNHVSKCTVKATKKLAPIVLPIIMYALMFWSYYSHDKNMIDERYFQEYLFHISQLINMFVGLMPDHPELTLLMVAERLFDYFELVQGVGVANLFKYAVVPTNEETKLINKTIEKVFGHQKELAVMHAPGLKGGQAMSRFFSKPFVFIDFDYFKKFFTGDLAQEFVLAHEMSHIANCDLLQMYVFLLGANVIVPYALRFMSNGCKKWWGEKKKIRKKSLVKRVKDGVVSVGVCILYGYAQHAIIFLLFQGFTRRLERQADARAVAALGNNRGAIEYFTTTLKLEEIPGIWGQLKESLEGWLSSHPLLRERLAKIRTA